MLVAQMFIQLPRNICSRGNVLRSRSLPVLSASDATLVVLRHRSHVSLLSHPGNSQAVTPNISFELLSSASRLFQRLAFSRHSAWLAEMRVDRAAFVRVVRFLFEFSFVCGLHRFNCRAKTCWCSWKFTFSSISIFMRRHCGDFALFSPGNPLTVNRSTDVGQDAAGVLYTCTCTWKLHCDFEISLTLIFVLLSNLGKTITF